MSFIRFGDDEITSKELGLVMKKEQTLPSSYRVLEEVSVPYRQDPVLFETGMYAELTLSLDFTFDSTRVVPGIPGYTTGSNSFDAMRPVIVAWFRRGVGYRGFQKVHIDPYAFSSDFGGFSLDALEIEGYMNDLIEPRRISKYYGEITLKIKVKPFVQGLTGKLPFIYPITSDVQNDGLSPSNMIKELVKSGVISESNYFTYTIPKEYLKPSTSYRFLFNKPSEPALYGYFTTEETVTDISFDTKTHESVGFSFTAWSGTAGAWNIYSPADPTYEEANVQLYEGNSSGTAWASIQHDGFFQAYINQLL